VAAAGDARQGTGSHQDQVVAASRSIFSYYKVTLDFDDGYCDLQSETESRVSNSFVHFSM
jgi:hypothetical protein